MCDKCQEKKKIAKQLIEHLEELEKQGDRLYSQLLMSKNKEKRVCSVCGRKDIEVWLNKHFGIYLCKKHTNEMMKQIPGNY